jgi:hypothetical protein
VNIDQPNRDLSEAISDITWSTPDAKNFTLDIVGMDKERDPPVPAGNSVVEPRCEKRSAGNRGNGKTT